MRIQFQLEKRESNFLKQQFLVTVQRAFGAKAVVVEESIEIDAKDEEQLLQMFLNAGLKFARQVKGPEAGSQST